MTPPPPSAPRKLIIDTDPGIDDTLAILAALASPEVQVIGLTSTFGNVTTATATQNIFTLLGVVGLAGGRGGGGGAVRPDGAPLPVAAGSPTMLNGTAKVRIADFVHGRDGFGNTHPTPTPGAPAPQSAAQFIAAAARGAPGEVTVLALGPLTNVALAYALGPDVAPALDVVALGGAFFRNGNVNPAAEANALGDPEAADAVFSTPGARVSAVGLDVTHACSVSRAAFTAWVASVPDPGRGVAAWLAAAVGFYMDYHSASYGLDGMFLHDPSALVSVLAPELFTWGSGSVVVDTGSGPTRGVTIMDAGEKDWGRGGGGVSCRPVAALPRGSGEGASPPASPTAAVAAAAPPPNAWVGRPRVRVATAVDAARVVDLALTRLRAAVVQGGERTAAA